MIESRTGFFVACDNCGKEGQMANTDTVAIAYAKRDGWKTACGSLGVGDSDRCHLCPACSAGDGVEAFEKTVAEASKIVAAVQERRSE